MELDPYWKWLGIPPDQQPPDHYALLGIARFETDEDVIENAAVRQMNHVRSFQGGQHAASRDAFSDAPDDAGGCVDPGLGPLSLDFLLGFVDR